MVLLFRNGFWTVEQSMITRSGRLVSSSAPTIDEFKEQLLSALEQQDIVQRFFLIFENQLKTHLDPFTKKLTDAIQSLTQTVTQLKGEIKSRDNTIRTLQSEVTQLQTRVEDLEQHGRRDSLRFFGIPEDEPGNTNDKVIKLCNKRLKLSPHLSKDGIAVSHRVGPPKQPTPNELDTNAEPEPPPPSHTGKVCQSEDKGTRYGRA